MNVRTSTNPVVVAASRGLARLNARHPWSHNDHFHGWIIRHLPAQRERALDVGCGRGALLARLAESFSTVEGTDRDDAMRESAARRCRHLPNVSVSGRQLADLDGRYDLITMIAVLHHLDIDRTLTDVRRLLAPAGKFLVVGLASPASRTDLVWDIASALANPVIGIVKHPRPTTTPQAEPPFPVKDPEVPFDELGSRFATELPGARLHRRLCFRYTAEWTAPQPKS